MEKDFNVINQLLKKSIARNVAKAVLLRLGCMGGWHA